MQALKDLRVEGAQRVFGNPQEQEATRIAESSGPEQTSLPHRRGALLLLVVLIDTIGLMNDEKHRACVNGHEDGEEKRRCEVSDGKGHSIEEFDPWKPWTPSLR